MMILILIIDTDHGIDSIDGIAGTLRSIVQEHFMGIIHSIAGIDLIVSEGMEIPSIPLITIMEEVLLTPTIMDVHHHLGEQGALIIPQLLMPIAEVIEVITMEVIMVQDVLVA